MSFLLGQSWLATRRHRRLCSCGIYKKFIPLPRSQHSDLVLAFGLYTFLSQILFRSLYVFF